MLLIIALLATCAAPFQELADDRCGCSRAPRTVLYGDRCLTAAELTKAYACPGERGVWAVDLKTGQPAELCWTDIVYSTTACIDHRARERRFNEPL